MNQRQQNHQGRPPQRGNFRDQTFAELGEKLNRDFFKEQSVLSRLKDASKADELIELTEKLVKEKGEHLSNSQLRNVYDKILNARTLLDLKMIRPQLAYMAGRITGRGANDVKSFLSFIDLLIKETQQDSIDDFKKFMEMIVAYHKYYGKNKN